MAARGKVYVIDDDEAMRDSLNFLLDAADFDVTLFESAQHFFDGLPSDFGCVVSDIRMPGGSGIELLSKIKAKHRDLPVIIMTAYSDLDSAVSAFQGGAFDYLPKPFDVPKAVEYAGLAGQQALTRLAHEDAAKRAGGSHGNKGEEAALVALEMTQLLEQLP